MKAFLVDRYGGDDAVRAGEAPEPELRDDDVLVEVHAASINPLDLRIRDGKLKAILPYRLPLILGNDVAGVVVRVGAGVRRFRPGDEVYARPDQRRIGTFAEFISMREDDVAYKPRELTMEEAASVPLVGLTAWQALVEEANVKRAQKVLIHAGSGGLGTFAIQLAKHLGAVVASTTSEANLDWVKRLGADVVIDYRNVWGSNTRCSVLTCVLVFRSVMDDRRMLLSTLTDLVSAGALAARSDRRAGASRSE